MVTSKRYASKKQAFHIFKSEVIPHIPSDLPTKRQCWNDYVDSLVKDGLLLESQVKHWTDPFSESE